VAPSKVSNLYRALQPYRARLERDLTTALHQQARSAVGGHLAVAGLLAFLIRGQVTGTTLLFWVGAIGLACAFRGWNAWRFSRLQEREISMRDQWLHSAAILGCGLVWSIGFVVVMPQLEVLFRAIVLLVLSGLSSAAIVTLSARISSFAFFASSLMVPAILSLASRGDSTERMLAGLGLVSLGFGFASCLKARALTLGHYLHRYRNEQMVRDLVSTKKSMEEALQRSETASKAKSEFLANMSHEVRTPMNGVLGMAELLGQGELREDQQEMLAILQSSGRDLLSILDDVLDLSKIEGDCYEFVSEPYHLPDLLDDLAGRHAIEAEEKGLEFVYDAPIELPDTVTGDANRLRQLLHNLLDNAVKFTDRGTITFQVRACHGGPEGNTLEVSVKDQGNGIPKEQIDAVFESFTQVDGSATRRHGGTGLGLTISRRLVELMGGTLEVESELGKGSCFLVRVPMQVQVRPRALTTPGHAVVLAPPTSSSNGLTARLQASGLQVRSVASIRDLQLDENRNVDWLLADKRCANEQELQQLARSLGARIVLLTESIGTTEGTWEGPILRRPYRIGALRKLFLPGADPASQPGNQDADPASHPLQMDVLVAEDNPTNARIAQRMLENFGMRVRIATNGREAVEAFQEHPPHLIFMDVQMPELDGMAATQEIRKLPGGADIPIIALTAHAMKGYREKCLEAGMNDYFTKPLRRADLSEALRRWQTKALLRKRA
jgi:signal transduction histidine kinase/ActR/RegA family two-component response regulator